ncbi:DUF4880 domain-containing protein [Sphingomonadaceae bacterium G21617-S1]|nr:DUF4880 domain-containing protein [Sphingomonadaceae bacterium G21617-S1]
MAGADQPPQSEPEQAEALREERAARYFARQLDDPSPLLGTEIDAWLSEDPRNAIAYARMAQAWDKAALLRSAPPAPDHDPRRPETHADRQGQDQQ